ncbi:MAG: DUF4446 family protein [Lachnospiraceae bacterium]|nr:DUF4446 family protein [Lachnospiraceae bacterium]
MVMNDNSIGMNISSTTFYIVAGIGVALLLAIIVLLIVVLVRQSRLDLKYYEFMRGSNGKSLESSILNRFSDIDRLIASDAKKSVEIKEIKDNILKVYQKTGIVKYDAFSEMGGKLSFALAMLDKENTGYVINAMHSREGCYTYIKEIIKGESFIQLGTEEKKAIDMAINSDNFIDTN